MNQSPTQSRKNVVIESLKYPFNEDNWHKTLSIGTILEILTFLFVPQLILQGYYIDVMKTTLEGKDEPPKFNNWKKQIIAGFKSVCILIVYKLLPIFIVIIYIVPTFLTAIQENNFLAALVSVLSSVLITGLLFGLFGYAASAGLVAFAKTKKIRSAFSPQLFRVILKKDYFLLSIYILGLTLVFLIIKIAISIIPIVNLLLFIIIPAIVKYLWVVYARIWTKAYIRASNNML